MFHERVLFRMFVFLFFFLVSFSLAFADSANSPAGYKLKLLSVIGLCQEEGEQNPHFVSVTATTAGLAFIAERGEDRVFCYTDDVSNFIEAYETEQDSGECPFMSWDELGKYFECEENTPYFRVTHSRGLLFLWERTGEIGAQTLVVTMKKLSGGTLETVGEVRFFEALDSPMVTNAAYDGENLVIFGMGAPNTPGAVCVYRLDRNPQPNIAECYAVINSNICGEGEHRLSGMSRVGFLGDVPVAITKLYPSCESSATNGTNLYITFLNRENFEDIEVAPLGSFNDSFENVHIFRKLDMTDAGYVAVFGSKTLKVFDVPYVGSIDNEEIVEIKSKFGLSAAPFKVYGNTLQFLAQYNWDRLNAHFGIFGVDVNKKIAFMYKKPIHVGTADKLFVQTIPEYHYVFYNKGNAIRLFKVEGGTSGTWNVCESYSRLLVGYDTDKRHSVAPGVVKKGGEFKLFLEYNSYVFGKKVIGDVFLVVKTPAGNFLSYVYPGGFVPGIVPAYSGVVPAEFEYTVFETEELNIPSGKYRVYFGVDAKRDGSFDFECGQLKELPLEIVD